MNEYEFTLKFSLPDNQADPAHFLDALAEAGCEDATVGIGRRGHIALSFVRQATTVHEAFVWATLDVQKAIPGAKLIETTPDLRSLPGAADHMTR